MAAKLKLALKSPLLPLILKALIFGGFLALPQLGDFGFIFIFLFLISAIFLYFHPLFNTFALLQSFGVLVVFSLLTLKAAAGTYLFIPSTLFLSFLFYLILGLKNLVFINRLIWYRLLNLLLFYLIFINFFWIDRQFIILKSLGVFLLTILLMRELLMVSAVGSAPKRRLFVSAVLAFATLQGFWVISLLPLGFLNSANLMIATVFILDDLILNYFQATLNRRIILKDVTAFVLLTLLIFITSEWGI